MAGFSHHYLCIYWLYLYDTKSEEKSRIFLEKNHLERWFFYGWNMAADTRVSITVDTGNAEGGLNRLRSVFQSLDAAANTASRDIDSAGRATQTAGSRATGAATALTGLSRATTTANSAMTSLHGSTFTYVGNTTQADLFE